MLKFDWHFTIQNCIGFVARFGDVFNARLGVDQTVGSPLKSELELLKMTSIVLGLTIFDLSQKQAFFTDTTSCKNVE